MTPPYWQSFLYDPSFYTLLAMTDAPHLSPLTNMRSPKPPPPLGTD